MKRIILALTAAILLALAPLGTATATAEARSTAKPTIVFVHGTFADSSGTDYDVYIKPDSFRAVFAADLPANTAALMAATQRPLSMTANNEQSGESAWKTLPSWALITLDDRAIPAAGQRFMAERAHARIRTVHSSHAVMVSHPDAVVSIVLVAAGSLG
ncbi:alpha/beta fold hydrolase [Nonomuraea aurantiaca]|uniref:alpha/beta fold hydrolase n=1 Tax=Nonomuraea aurantiaca TaxID=2878562 RepID=UPI001CDA3EBD|nr:alpha/beta hydrolase [Nonomuraea aurantiaca]MCA2229686.1 alpha/beta hydrolase [Nonomuraea aurantiaca]